MASVYHILPPTTPLLTAHCPPGTKPIAGSKRCRAFAQKKKRLAFKSYLVKKELMALFEDFCLDYIMDEYSKPKPANAARLFAMLTAERLGWGDYVDKFIKKRKQDLQDVHSELIHREETFDERFAARVEKLEQMIEQVQSLHELKQI